MFGVYICVDLLSVVWLLAVDKVMRFKADKPSDFNMFKKFMYR